MLHPDLLARLCRARDLLRELDDGPRPVGVVARATGISPFHFIRLYKAVFGETPHRCQARAQIERAKHLLILTDATVTDVCLQVGFSSVGTFSTHFRRCVGEAPSSYQRRHRRVDGRPLDALPPAMIPGCMTLMGRASA